MQKLCANKIKEIYSSLFKNQNDLCEFIGYCFVAAGIYMEENEFYDKPNEYTTYRDYLIQNIKALFKG